jgi:hypothetical protein
MHRLRLLHPACSAASNWWPTNDHVRQEGSAGAELAEGFPYSTASDEREAPRRPNHNRSEQAAGWQGKFCVDIAEDYRIAALLCKINGLLINEREPLVPGLRRAMWEYLPECDRRRCGFRW